MRSRLALLLASCLLALALGEAAVRVLGLQVRLGGGMRYEPALGWIADPGQRRADGFVDPGFRHAVEANAKPSGVRRLAVLGDSFSVGAALPWRLTFAGLLQELLAPERIEVVNLAAGGWGTAQELRALERYGPLYQPDLVVLEAFPYNDLCDNAIALAGSCSQLDLYRPYAVLGREGLRFRAASRLRGWLRASRLFAVAENRIEAERRARSSRGEVGARLPYTFLPEDAQSDALRDAWRVSEALLGELARSLGEAGVPFSALVLPHPDSLQPGWRDAFADAELVADYGERRFAGILRDLGVPVASLREHLARDPGPWRPEDLFHPRPDDPHLNEVGHLVAARLVLETLVAGGHVSAAALERLAARSRGVAADWIEQTGLPAALRGLDRTSYGAGLAARSVLAPEVSLVFAADEARAFELCFLWTGLAPEAALQLRCGEDVLGLRTDAAGALGRCVSLHSAPGRNRVAFLLPSGGGPAELRRLALRPGRGRPDSFVAPCRG